MPVLTTLFLSLTWRSLLSHLTFPAVVSVDGGFVGDFSGSVACLARHIIRKCTPFVHPLDSSNSTTFRTCHPFSLPHITIISCRNNPSSAGSNGGGNRSGGNCNSSFPLLLMPAFRNPAAWKHPPRKCSPT